MQVAAMSPLVVRPEDLTEETLESERRIYRQQFADKPEQVRERIVDGKIEKFYEEVCLVRQRYIRDDTRTVDDLIKEMIAKLGENLQVRRFVRMELGCNSED